MIEDLKIRELRCIPDEKGDVLHMLRADAPHFQQFGEVYFSKIVSGSVKAWKRHKVQTQNLAVPCGEIKIVIYDNREDSLTKGEVVEIVTGENCYKLITIPPMLWYGFICTSAQNALIANCADLPHDPQEAEKIDPTTSGFPYTWDH